MPRAGDRFPLGLESDSVLFEQGSDQSQTPNLIERASELAERIKLPQSALDYLYRHSQWPCASQTAWEKDVKTACAIGSMMRGLDQSMHQREFSRIADGVDLSGRLPAEPGGTLLLTIHGGFTVMARWLFRTAIQDGLLLGKGGIRSGDGRKLVQRNGHYGDILFAALRHIQGGGTLLLAPDGLQGKRTESIDVLGRGMRLGDGATFIAHTTGCATVWYNLVRKGDYFSPVLEHGPRREERESFNEFQNRLYSFLKQKIEDIFVGDPRNIAVTSRWGQLFH